MLELIEEETEELPNGNKLKELQKHLNNTSSSLSQIYFKIGVLKKFTNFTGKHLCWSFFLIKVQNKAYNLIKKRLQHRYFPDKFAKSLRTFFCTEHFSWLLLWHRETIRYI